MYVTFPICTMHSASLPTHTHIKYTLVQFCRNAVTVDEMFQKILPPELTQRIIHYAYGANFYDFFISSQSLRLFSMAKFDYSPPFIISKNPEWNCYINSNKLDPHKFHLPHSPFNSPTSACLNKNPDVVFLGYCDGTIKAYPKNENNMFHDELHYETHCSSPITAIAFAMKELHNDQDGGLLIAGHADGSLSLCFSDQVERIDFTYTTPEDNTPIVDIIALPRTLLFAKAHTITVMENYWNWKICKGVHLESFLSYNCARIGHYGCMVIAHLENDLYCSITPYSESDLMHITEGGLSPSQAYLLYQAIEYKKNNTLVPDETKTSLTAILSPLMNNVLGIFSKL